MSRFPTLNHLALTVLSAVVTFFAAADVAMAHPGHGTAPAEAGVLHYLTSPMHVVPPLVVPLLCVVAFRLVKTWNKQG